MKTSTSVFRSTRLVTVALSLLALAATARAENLVRYKARPIGSMVHIDGKANIHNWTMEGSIISGFVDVPADVTLDSAQAAVAGAPADGKLGLHAEVRIPVTSIKNGHFEGMDEVMQDAMKAKDFPAIEYRLSEIVLKQPHAAGTPFQFDAKGELSLHGVTNKIAMPVTIESVDKTKLKIVGSAIPVKMTDYGIKPPVKAAIFTTEDEVKISFEFIVAVPLRPGTPK